MLSKLLPTFSTFSSSLEESEQGSRPCHQYEYSYEPSLNMNSCDANSLNPFVNVNAESQFLSLAGDQSFNADGRVPSQLCHCH